MQASTVGRPGLEPGTYGLCGVSVPEIRHPLPRAPDAVSDRSKWTGWILAAGGHGEDWAAVFGVGLDDADRIWECCGSPSAERR